MARALALSIAVLCSALAAAPRPSSTLIDARPISAKQNPATNFVYVEHDGAYWTVGGKLNAARDLMVSRNESGPMTVRHPVDPSEVPAGRQRCRVGYLTTRDDAPPPPFQIESVPEELVISTIVEDSFGSALSQGASLRVWARENGDEPTGPIHELFLQPEIGAKTGVRTEIQLAVRRSNPLAEPPPADDPLPAAIETHNDTPTGKPTEPKAGPRPAAELIAAGEFDLLAAQLMPDGRTFSGAESIWLGQVVFRIRAVAKGLKTQQPEHADRLVKLGETLVARFRARGAKSTTAALEQAVVRVEPGTDAPTARRRDLMRDLDLLLGRVATGAIEADFVETELGRILQGVLDVLLR